MSTSRGPLQTNPLSVKPLLVMGTNERGQVVWWIDNTLAKNVNQKAAVEILDSLKDFLSDFQRPRG